MSDIDKAIDFIGGGNKGCLFEIIAEAVCGDCTPEGEACDTCQAQKVITAMENQTAAFGLDFMKRQAQEWVKYSIER